jgi:tetratricopeptide (TPR) repeat protein
MLKLVSRDSSATSSSLKGDWGEDNPKERNNQLYGHKINIDNLVSICTAKLAVNPLHKKALFIRATSFMKKKMFEEAIEDCHRLLNIDPRSVGAYFIIGSAYQKLGEIDIAIENLSIVL